MRRTQLFRKKAGKKLNHVGFLEKSQQKSLQKFPFRKRLFRKI